MPFVEELHLNVRKVPGVAPAEYAAGLLDLFDSGAIRLKTPMMTEALWRIDRTLKLYCRPDLNYPRNRERRFATKVGRLVLHLRRLVRFQIYVGSSPRLGARSGNH